MNSIESFVLEWEWGVAPVQLEQLSQSLREARIQASRGETADLITLCNLLPAAVKKITDGKDVAVWSQEPEFHCYVFQVMWMLVELAVAVFSKQVEYPLTQSIDLLTFIKLLEALSAAFDSNSQYFKLRSKKLFRREILVFPWLLDSVLQVPGFFVKESGVNNGQIHYFCLQKGVNHTGDACECCKPPREADAVLVNLTWLLANTVSGSGYEYILRMLRSPKQLSLISVELLLRPLIQLLTCNAGTKTWRRLIQHVEDSFRNEFKNLCFDACTELYRYLDEIVRSKEFNPCPNFDTEYANQWTFTDVLNHLHTITSWGVSYYGGNVAFDSLSATVCKLQEKMWERLLDAKRFSMACTSIGAAIEATLPPASGNSMLSLEWLKEKKIVLRLLNVRYERKNVSKVIDFVNILAKKKQFVLEEKDFLAVMKNAGTRSTNPRLTILDTNADDMIVAAMLNSFELGSYSAEFLEYVLKWLEDCPAASAINGQTMFRVLSKILIYDNHRKWEQRFLNLLWKHAANIPDSDLVNCFCKVADHYTAYSEIESLKKSVPTSEEQARLLQACSSADTVTCISDDVIGALNHTKLYGQIAKSWEEKEADLHLVTSSNLANVLAIDVPFSRHDTAQECLKRLLLAQQLTGGLNTDGSNTLASCMSTALTPEFQTLEALKKESVLRCEVIRQVQELNEKHVREYDAMRQEQHERLVKFFQACRKEKEDVVWEALYQKAKVLAGVKKGKINRDVKSSEEILSRMLQKAEGAFKEVGDKHRENLERLPNVECAVCFSEFSMKRKRACLDPCGHASACVDCATQEWKRSKTCPLCKTSIEKPIAVPFKLFF